MINVSLDTENYFTKPNKIQFRLINNRIIQNAIPIEIKELADEVTFNGRAFSPAIFKGGRNKNCFQQAQLIGIDFDDGIKYKDVRERCKEFELPVAFSYETYSSSEHNPRFRLVFCLDGIITYSCIYELLVNLLLKVFPEADPACRDCSRIFLGSTKGVLDLSDRFCSISNIIRAGEICMRNSQYKNYSRNIKKLANQYGVEEEDGHIRFILSKNEDKTSGTYTIYKVDASESSFYEFFPRFKKSGIVHDTHPQHPLVSGEKNSSNKRNFLHRIKNACPLFRDLLDEDNSKYADMSHDEHMILMTNLLNVEGGRKIFFGKIKSAEPENLSKWEYDWDYCVRNGYKAYPCAGRCRYNKCCNHQRTIVDTASQKIIQTKIQDYCTLEEAENDLKKQFQKAVETEECNKHCIHLIKAQTGIGKTKVYTEYVANAIRSSYASENKHFLIALPTNKLKQEVYNRLLDVAPDLQPHILMSVGLEELPITDTMFTQFKLYYETGFVDKVENELKKHGGQFLESAPEWELYNRFLNFSNLIKCFNPSIIITTHSRLIQMKKDILKNYSVIIDEDFLRTMIGQKKVIYSSDIEMLMSEKKISENDWKILRKIQKMGEKMCLTIDTGLNSIKYSYINKYEIVSNFKELRRGSTLIKTKDHVEYINPDRLYWDTKIIVISATADGQIYERYFGKDRVKLYHCKKAKYEGQVIQYTRHNLSRKEIADYGKKRTYRCIKDITSKVPVITFKSLKKETDPLHFGYTEGLDIYKGKDIAVIGTPYPNPDQIHFWYYVIQNTMPEDFTFNRFCTEYGGYSFQIPCYKEPIMQRIQNYLIMSELEQAVGRARVIRCYCKVFVFSCYPVAQANFLYDEYLE